MSIRLKDTIYDLVDRSTKDGSGNTITSTYLKLSGGTLTGDLILNAGNEDRFLKFQYNNGDTYGWRIGYLGSGSGDANYLVIQTSQETAATWTNALRLGNTNGDALFSATVTASGGFIGALTGNVTGNVTGNITGSSGSCTGNAASATKLATARTLWGQSFNGTANVSGNMTGVGSISMSSTLTLTGTAAETAAINFSRASYNYIHAPASGLICLQPNGMGATSAAGYHFNGTEFFPGANNTYTLGTSSKKWKNVYATTFTGALSGNATSSSSCSGNSATATLASTVTCSETNSNYDRPLVGTPGNNNLYYTTLATVNWSTGKIICGGLQSKDITLYSASGDSPHLIFQRGGLYDGTYDWDMFVTGGTLKFRVNKSSATAASYTDILKMYNDDDTIRSTWPIYASTFKNSSGTEVSYSGHTHSAYYDSTLSRTANTVLAAPNGSAGTASFRKLVAADIPTLAISKISGLQSALDGKSATGHTHNYAGSDSAGGPANTVKCGAGTGDADRNILVTNGSNGVYYSSKVKLNYSTGRITCGAITITDTTAVEHIKFSRANSYNYVTFPSGSYLAFISNGKSVGSDTPELIVSTNIVYPGTTNVTSLGTSSLKWSNVYATTFTGKMSTSFTVFGQAYNGSAAKTVTGETLVGTLSEGTSNLTDGTMLLTSYASDNGFADTNAPNKIYKRKASCVWGYIKGKTDAAYAASSHTHSAYYDSGVSRTANTVLAAPNGSAGSATFRKLVAADLPSHTHSGYASSSHTHSYAGSSSAGGAATSANKLNTNAGDGYKPVYFTNGVPTACTYGFNGAYGMPVVLAAGYIYKSSYTSTTWTFSGSYCPALTGGITTSVSGGVLAVTWTAASGRSRYIYGAVANMRTSGAVTSYSGTEYKDRSLGMYWLGTATSTSTTYIRAMSQGDQNNDTGMSYDEMWGTSSEQSDHCILSFSIIVIGYWT